MNSIIENKLKNFKVREDYKLSTEPGKKIYTIFNEELKEIFWELFSQMVKVNVGRVTKNGSKKESEEEYFAPVVDVGGEGEKSWLIFYIGETAAEKDQREKKSKEEMEETIKRSEEITKRCEEIDKIGNNTEQKNQFEQWEKAGRKCHICGKEAGSFTVSFAGKQRKLTITCSLECLKKSMKDNGNSENQTQQQTRITSEKPNLPPSASPANKSTTIFWIIGGIATLTIGGFIY